MPETAIGEVGMSVDPNLAAEANEALNPAPAAPASAQPAVKTAPVSPGQAPAEGVKSVIPAKPVSESVPYTRFQQVNEEAKRNRELAIQYERMLAPVRDRLTLDPRTGQYVLQQPQAPDPNQTVSDQEWRLFSKDGLTNGFTDQHWGVFEKILAKVMQVTQAQTIQAIQSQFSEKETREKTWADTVKEFPEAGDANSELRQLAEKIARENFLQNRNGQAYISPQNQYDAVLRAWRQLERQKAATTQAQAQAETAKQPIVQQNAFVGTKTVKGARKATYSDKEFEKLSPEEQESVLQQQASEAGLE